MKSTLDARPFETPPDTGDTTAGTTLRQPSLAASLYGAFAGLIYGLCEYIAAVVDPMLQSGALGPGHWIWETVFLSAYAIAGAVIGAAAAAAFRRAAPFRAATRSVVAAALLALVLGQLVSHRVTAPIVIFALALLLEAAFVLADLLRLKSPVWISWLCSPWIAFPVALSLVKLKSRFTGAAVLAGVILVLLAGVTLAIFALARVPRLHRSLAGHFLTHSAAASAALLIVLPWISLSLDALPAISARGGTGVANHDRPNVLLIVMDTVRADHLSVYGYGRRTTPNLETLAYEGVLFRNAVSASDLTLSSYGSLFTGLYPSWHGAHLVPGKAPGRLAPSFHTMAEILSENGYTAVAELANCAHMAPVSGLSQGFDLYDTRRLINGSWAGDEYYLRDLIRQVLKHFVSTVDLVRPYRRADQITDRGLRALRILTRRKTPFFLTLNYMDAHAPYLPPAPFCNRFPGYNPAFNTPRISDELGVQLALLKPPAGAPAELAHLASQYEGGIAFMDAEIKRLLDGIKKTGVYDNTLIILTADHGEALGERSALGHPASVHEEMVHVPLFIKYPHATHAETGGQVDTRVSGIDILPTILDVTGIGIPPELPGRSLRRNLAGDRAILTESFPDGLSRLRRRKDVVQRALYKDQWKFIGLSTGQQELYDLGNDPTERQNLAAQNPALAQQLSRELGEWLRTLPRRPNTPAANDPETVKRLRSLGYIQ